MPNGPKTKSSTEVSVHELKRVLTRFAELSANSAQREKRSTSEQSLMESRRERDAMVLTVKGYTKAFDRWKEKQAIFAEDFNILEALQVTGKEIRHSMMLAWLFDHDLGRHGTHAQGALGFELFLEVVGLPKEYASCQYWVRREVKGDESRVDLEIAARGRFLIHIENKIWSGEGESQTSREWNDLTRRAKELDATSVHGFFLTPDGRAAQYENFVPISWAMIADVLRRFSEKAQAREVRLFCAHYARALDLFIVRTLREETSDGDAII